MDLPFRSSRAAAYPQLDTGEKVVAEATLGRDVAVLTNRRLVVSGRDIEQSFPLAAIGVVRARFVRSVRAMVAGALLLAAALALATLAAPVRGAIGAQIASLETAHRAEQTQAQAQPEAAPAPPATQVVLALLRALAALAGLMSPAALVLAILGGVRLAFGLIGETRVTVTAGGAELGYARLGRDAALREFVAEVGRNLPAPR
ncbi:MAG: hypothetical protein N2544_14320 [Burkholderiales bacterium]|nr:hypothetical protein [Burkholderiales bacterium]